MHACSDFLLLITSDCDFVDMGFCDNFYCWQSIVLDLGT